MSTKSYSKILITGSIAYDDIMDFPNKFVDFFQPDKLHQINISFVVDKLEKQLGGTATNITYNTKLLTDHRLQILGAVGKDGHTLFDFLKKNNIDTGGLLVDNNLYTSTGKVITDQNDNQIWGFYYGASVRGKDIDLSQFGDKESLLLIGATHSESFIHFQDQAAQLGIDYIYDPGMVITTLPVDKLREGILHSKYFIANDYEVAQLLKMTKLSMKEILEKGIVVITTLGEKGVKYESSQETITVPTVKLKKIVDPTGAGDAWRGGFIAGLVEGKSIVECLKQGNAIASFAVEKYGTVNHSPSLKEIQKRMDSISL